MERDVFEQIYAGQAPWDTGRPQPAVVKLAEAGKIPRQCPRRWLLGENALYLAAKGHKCWGLDFVPVAIERAKAKAVYRQLDAHFLVGNALELNKLGRQSIRLSMWPIATPLPERSLFVKGLGDVVGLGGGFPPSCS